MNYYSYFPKFTRYWQVILLRQLYWVINKKKLSGLFTIFKLIIFQNKYKTWWNQQIVYVYRNKYDSLAFSESYKELPSKWDLI